MISGLAALPADGHGQVRHRLSIINVYYIPRKIREKNTYQFYAMKILINKISC
jgi:hypothetical protein